MADFVNDEDEPPELTDFGFNNDPEYVWETCSIFVNSSYHVMPNAGGWDDQPADWRDDCMIFLALYHRAHWEKRQRNSNGKERDPLDYFFKNGGGAGDLLDSKG